MSEKLDKLVNLAKRFGFDIEDELRIRAERRRKVMAMRAEKLEQYRREHPGLETRPIITYPKPSNVQLAVLLTMKEGHQIAYRVEKRTKNEHFWVSGRYFPKVKRRTIRSMERQGWITLELLQNHNEPEFITVGQYTITDEGRAVVKYWLGLL